MSQRLTSFHLVPRNTLIQIRIGLDHDPTLIRWELFPFWVRPCIPSIICNQYFGPRVLLMSYIGRTWEMNNLHGLEPEILVHSTSCQLEMHLKMINWKVTHWYQTSVSEKKMNLSTVLARVRVQGGHGGNGAAQFCRLKYNAKAGPNGGGGGSGGHVIFTGKFCA